MGDKDKIGRARQARQLVKRLKNRVQRAIFEHPYHLDKQERQPNYKHPDCPKCHA